MKHFFYILPFLWNISFAQTTQIVLQAGFQGDASSLDFSNDGRYLATGSAMNGTIKIWDLSSGKEIITLSGHSYNVTNVKFLKDGKRLLSASNNGLVILYDVFEEKVLQKFETRSVDMVLSPDEKTVWCAGFGVQQWDMESGKILKDFKLDGNLTRKIFISQDGKEVGTFYKNILAVLDANDGAIKRKITAGVNGMDMADINANWKYAASNADDMIHIWDLGSGTLLKTFHEKQWSTCLVLNKDGSRLLSGGHDSLNVYDCRTGNKLWSFDDEVSNACFSKDERYVAIGNDDNHIMIFDAETGAKAGELMGHTKGIDLAEVSPDGKKIAVFSRQSKVFRVFDLETGGNKSIKFDGLWLEEIVWKDNRILGVLEEGGEIDLYDSELGILIKEIKSGDFSVKDFSFLPDDSTVLGLSEEFGEVRFSLNTGIMISQKKLISTELKFPTYSSNKKWVAIADNPKEFQISIYSTENGKQLKQLTLPETTETVYWGNAPKPNFPKTVTGVKYIKTGDSMTIISEARPMYNALALSHDGKFLAAAETKGIWLWNLETETVTSYLEEPFITPRKLAFSMDDKTLASGGATFYDNLKSGSEKTSISLWDLNTFKQTTSLQGHLAPITQLEFTPNSNQLMSASDDGSVRLWDYKNASETATLIPIDEQDFIFLIPSNYYMASHGGLSGVCLKDGNNGLPLEQFDLVYNRPDKVLAAFEISPPNYIKACREAWLKRIKKYAVDTSSFSNIATFPKAIVVEKNNLPFVTKSRELGLEIQCKPAGQKLQTMNIWVNEVPVYGMNGKPVLDTFSHPYPINLSAGRNKIQVSCTDVKGHESMRQTLEMQYDVPPAKPNLYFIALCVKDYADEKMNLNYTVQDGRALAEAFAEDKKSYSHVFVDTLFNRKATKETFLALKEKLKKSTEEDIVVVFVSGHGLLSKSLDFYYATQDVDFDNPEIRGISYDEFETFLDGIPSRKKLLLMDACHSGESDKESESRGVTARQDSNSQLAMSNEQLAQRTTNNEQPTTDSSKLKTYSFRAKIVSRTIPVSIDDRFELMQQYFTQLNKGSGTSVISAAAGKGYALESREWEHGVFTFAILEALKDWRTDTNRDGGISFSELNDYVTNRVETLTKGKQIPVSRRAMMDNDFRVKGF